MMTTNNTLRVMSNREVQEFRDAVITAAIIMPLLAQWFEWSTPKPEVAEVEFVKKAEQFGFEWEEVENVIGDLLDAGVIRSTIVECPNGFLPALVRA